MNWKELPPLLASLTAESRQSSFRLFAIVCRRFNRRRKYLFGFSCRRIRLSRSDRVINVSRREASAMIVYIIGVANTCHGPDKAN